MTFVQVAFYEMLKLLLDSAVIQVRLMTFRQNILSVADKEKKNNVHDICNMYVTVAPRAMRTYCDISALVALLKRVMGERATRAIRSRHSFCKERQE